MNSYCYEWNGALIDQTTLYKYCSYKTITCIRIGEDCFKRKVLNYCKVFHTIKKSKDNQLETSTNTREILEYIWTLYIKGGGRIWQQLRDRGREFDKLCQVLNFKHHF